MWNPRSNPKRKSAVALVVAITLALVAAGWAQTPSQGPLPTTEPEQVGLSSERLANIEELFEAGIEVAEIPGAVALVARDGQVAYFEAFGQSNAAESRPMTTDTIFR